MVQPSLGHIVETFQAIQVETHAAGVASAALDERRDQLRDLVAHRPPPALSPEDVSQSVAARLEHEATIATLQEEIRQLERIVEARMAQARALRAEHSQLWRRAEELRNAILPSGRRSLTEAQQHLSRLKAELLHTVGLAERRVEVLGQVLIGYEAELATLTGEGVR